VITRNGFWKHGPLGYHLPQKGTKSYPAFGSILNTQSTDLHNPRIEKFL